MAKEAPKENIQSQDLNQQLKGIYYGTPELEDIRKTLLNQYHSYSTSHTGLIIAVIIGSLTLLSRWDIFFKSGFTIIIFYIMLSFIVGLSFYILGRLSYWTSLSNMTLVLTEQEFSEYHRAQSEKPCICSMQMKVASMTRSNRNISLYSILGKWSSKKLLMGSVALSVMTYLFLTSVTIILQLPMPSIFVT